MFRQGIPVKLLNIDNPHFVKVFTGIYSIIFSVTCNILLQCVYPNGHSFFHSKTRNFTVAPKRPIVLLQWNTKSRIVPKRPFVLLLRNTKFLKLFQTNLFDNKLKNLKLPPNCHSFFEQEIQNLKLYPNDLSLLNINSQNRNLIYFFNELIVIQKTPRRLLGNYVIVN